MDTIDPLSLIPPAWLATIEAYAPHALLWLLAATALVHLLVPVARAVERWALLSSVTWDDGPARRAVEILEWLASATAAILARLPRLAVGAVGSTRATTSYHPSEVGTRRPSRPPADGALGLVLMVLAASLSVATSGCSTRALGVQADLVASGGILWTEADAKLVELRAADLDSIVDAAREECANGCSEERQTHWRAELAAAEERWAPAMECRATVPAALRSWLDGIEAAREAKTSEIGMELLARLGGRFALDYVAFVGCVNARAPVDDPHLPPLPAELEALAEMLTEATAARTTAGGEDGTR